MTSQQLPLSLYKVKEVSGQSAAPPESHSAERYCSLLTDAETELSIISVDLEKVKILCNVRFLTESLLGYLALQRW